MSWSVPDPIALTPWTAAGTLLAGALLGVIYFGGLWWTVRGLADLRRPYLVLAVSFVVRTGLVLAGFAALVVWGGWWPPWVALAGFLLVRLWLTRRLGPASRGEAAAGGHAGGEEG